MRNESEVIAKMLNTQHDFLCKSSLAMPQEAHEILLHTNECARLIGWLEALNWIFAHERTASKTNCRKCGVEIPDRGVAGDMCAPCAAGQFGG